MLDVSRWLAEQGLGHHAQAFAANGIAGDVLRDLTDADLKELGLNLGDRKRLLKAITALNAPALLDRQERGWATTPVLPREAERRQLTVMFVDLVGSTELAARLDPEDMSALIRAYQNAVAGEITRFEGHVAKYMGDGVLAYFGYPVAHEEEAERAVRAGLAIVKALAGLRTPSGEPLAARIGIATGSVVVGELIGEGAAQEQAVVGETPNRAARLQSLAEPGRVVISQATRRLVGSLFELADLGPQHLKGFAEPVRAWRVVGIGAAENRFEAMHVAGLTPLVGREHELALLLDRWERAKDGEGQVVLLSGEPGIGKSRLAQALHERLAAEPQTRLRYHCSPYHVNSALFPVIDHLERAGRCRPDDTAQTRLDKLEAVLAETTENLTEVVPLLAALLMISTEGRYPPLELTPEAQKARTFEALMRQVAALAERRPVLMVLEDALWIDPTSAELFGLLIDRIQRLPVLLLVTFRPEFSPPWTGHGHVTSLTLCRLGRRQGAAMIERLTDSKALPAEVLSQILAKTDGVPLFVEELTKTVLESGLLRERGDGFVLERPLDHMAIPSSLYDSLMARLDRLQSVKEVAQTAACIGREFDHRLLAAVSLLPEAALEDALDRLTAAELVFRRGTPPEKTYTFKHALLRDAAYESLLRAKRQQVHARVVEVLERSKAEVAPEILAHHGTAAGLTDKAIEYWQEAGERAIARPAYGEAIGHLSSAIRLVQEKGDDRPWRERELQLQIELGQALIAAHGYAAEPTVRAFERALELAEDLGDTPLRVPALFGEWVARYTRAQPTADLVARFAAIAEARPDAGPRQVGLRMRALEHYHGGRFAEAHDLLEQALALYDPKAHRHLGLEYAHDPRAVALVFRCWTLWQLGYPNQAHRAGEDAIAWAHELDHANTIGIAECWGGLLASALGRHIDRVEPRARRLIDYADETAMSLWRAWSRIFLGWALAHRGRPEDGLREIAVGLAETHRSGARRLLPILLGLAAEGALRAGEHDAAMARIDEAFDAVERSQDVAWSADLHRIRADLLLKRQVPDPGRAEAELNRALELARDQGAKSLELRAATSLARLLHDLGKPAEARDLLAPVHDWFTEGFDTPDLRKAKTLLDEFR